MSDTAYLFFGVLITLPGLYALYVSLHRDLEDKNLKLQVENYATEIRRLETLVDEQQRKINDMVVTIASLKSKLSALGKAFKRLSAQLKRHNIEPALDADKLVEMLERDDTHREV